MENTTNRNDAEDTFRSFFIGLDEAYQREVIQKMQKQPPDPVKDLHDSQCKVWEKVKSDSDRQGGSLE